MRILFIADAFAAAGRRIIEERLPALRSELGVGFVIANAENVADGVGITSRIARKLFQVGVDVITLSSGNEVRGFVIDPSGAGGGIAGGAAATGGGTIQSVDITDTGTAGTQPGLRLNGTTGTFNVSSFTVSTTAATGVSLNNAGTVNLAAAGTISTSPDGAVTNLCRLVSAGEPSALQSVVET